MAHSLQTTTPARQVAIKGRLFSARGGSCSCDPCDCNPCTCGDTASPNPPLWRVSGYVIEEGRCGETDLSHLVILSLAQPREDGTWEEILLVDKLVTPEQVALLILLFEDELESFPAELGPLSHARRAVYRIPLTYHADETRPLLQMTLTQEQCVCVRTGEQKEVVAPREWIYDGPMALRGSIERLHEVRNTYPAI